jgi:hypothetical protein
MPPAFLDGFSNNHSSTSQSTFNERKVKEGGLVTRNSNIRFRYGYCPRDQYFSGCETDAWVLECEAVWAALWFASWGCEEWDGSLLQQKYVPRYAPLLNPETRTSEKLEKTRNRPGENGKSWQNVDRLSGLWGAQTPLGLYLQENEITTLFFGGVNADQCVVSSLPSLIYALSTWPVVPYHMIQQICCTSSTFRPPKTIPWRAGNFPHWSGRDFDEISIEISTD